MDEILTVDEINARYPNSCVLVFDAEKDEKYRLLRARVAGSGTNRAEALAHARKVPHGRVAAFHLTDRPTPNGTIYML